MNKHKNFIPAGVIPATLLPFNTDFSINWSEMNRHLQDVCATDGLSAITVNGHASEIHACTLDEQQEILERTVDCIAEKAGASALLVFPSNALMMGGELRPEMAETHFKIIADATDLPLIAFNYARWTNLAYPLDTLLRLFEAVPSIRAIKDWTAEPAEHERNVSTLQSLARPVNVLSTNSAWLMQSLGTGCNGLLSGAGSIIPDLQSQLFKAMQQKNLADAQQLNERIRPIAQAFYRAPFLDMHNRMKEAAVLLGRQDRAVVRPPLMKLPQAEIDSIAAALIASGLLEDTSKTSAVTTATM